MYKKIVLDKEIDFSENDDLFNYSKTYVETLKNIITDTNVDKGLTIGLFGGWGTGKSSIVTTVKNELENKGNIAFVTYNAWKYSNDTFRRMFLITMQQELGFNKKN